MANNPTPQSNQPKPVTPATPAGQKFWAWKQQRRNRNRRNGRPSSY